jgi:hypothetical protein
MKTPCTCIECQQPLHQYEQECGPFTRNADGELIATGRTVIVECVNAKCDLWMVTASVQNYPTTTATYLNSRRAKANVHA